jgi:hypothetical protein
MLPSPSIAAVPTCLAIKEVVWSNRSATMFESAGPCAAATMAGGAATTAIVDNNSDASAHPLLAEHEREAKLGAAYALATLHEQEVRTPTPTRNDMERKSLQLLDVKHALWQEELCRALSDCSCNTTKLLLGPACTGDPLETASHICRMQPKEIVLLAIPMRKVCANMREVGPTRTYDPPGIIRLSTFRLRF